MVCKFWKFINFFLCYLQGLLASASQVCEEKLRNKQDMFREEVLLLKDENCPLSEEKKKRRRRASIGTKRSCIQGKIFHNSWREICCRVKDWWTLPWLRSMQGFLENMEDKSVLSYKASSVFHERFLIKLYHSWRFGVVLSWLAVEEWSVRKDSQAD